MPLIMASLSDVGRARDNNEDAACQDPEAGFTIVADGMGGHAGGHVASDLAVRVVADVLRRARPAQRDDEEAMIAALQQGVFAANDHILAQARQDPELFDMGTTLVVCLFLADRVITANVGDSRIYRLADGRIEQISEDHSLVAERIRSGELLPDSSEAKMLANIVTRAVGMEQVAVDITVEPLRPGDTYILCSDGLSDIVKPHEIAAVISNAGSNLQRACIDLVDLANARGGPDNITVSIARYVAAS